MKQPDHQGDLAAKMLYSSVHESDSNVATPTAIINPRPSLIPGVKYPIPDRDEELLDHAWEHFCRLKRRGLV